MSCDILALPRTENGSQFVVVFIDQFSRYCELRVIPDKTADSIAYAFMNAVIARWGCPAYLTSDNGPEFANNVIVKLCEKLNIRLWLRVGGSRVNLRGNGVLPSYEYRRE